MPTFKKYKNKNGKYTTSQLQKAVDDVRIHQMSQRSSAIKHGINRITLSRYVKNALEHPDVAIKKKSIITAQVSSC